MKLAYLVSRYPSVSHTFILREVQAMRKLGVEVGTFSVRRPITGDVLGAEARQEMSHTKSLVPTTMRDLTAALTVLLAFSTSAPAADRSGPAFDWSPWRYLPVQDGGRRKPLDTLARETMQSLSDRTSFTDPKTGQKLDSWPSILFTGLFGAALSVPQATKTLDCRPENRL